MIYEIHNAYTGLGFFVKTEKQAKYIIEKLNNIAKEKIFEYSTIEISSKETILEEISSDLELYSEIGIKL
jgi:hypothetical protein